MEFDFIGPNDKPAMILLSNPEWQESAKASLFELGYKVHTLMSHEEFASRFAQIQYQIIITEVLFAASNPSENLSLANLQHMPMNLRRHATVLLIGPQFETLNAIQAFQQSVHTVINPRELHSLGQIIQQAVSDNELFYGAFKTTQLLISQGKL